MDSLQRIKDLLFELTQLPGVSGMEQSVVVAMRDALQPLADEVKVDAFGNVIAIRRGPEGAPRIMIAAHSDEVGAVVTAINPAGLLNFQTVGVINSAVLPATRVRVDNRYAGTISSVPGHLNNHEGAQKYQQAQRLHIDIGATSADEIRALGIREGASVVFESPLVVLEGGRRVMGKAIDNRVGCAILIHLFEQIKDLRLPVTVYGVVNVLEEIGMRGARMTSSRLNPDCAIALDTVPADDTPLSPGSDINFSIGGGPVIQLWEGKAEQFLGTVAHPAVRDLILASAQAAQIKVQLSAAYGYWTTDGAAMHTTGEGIPTGFVSIPRRYAHTPNELLDLQDAVDAVGLLKTLLTQEAANFRPSFLPAD